MPNDTLQVVWFEPSETLPKKGTETLFKTEDGVRLGKFFQKRQTPGERSHIFVPKEGDVFYDVSEVSEWAHLPADSQKAA